MKVYHSSMAIYLTGVLFVSYCANTAAVQQSKQDDEKRFGLSLVKTSSSFQATGKMHQRIILTAADKEYDYFQIQSEKYYTDENKKGCLQPASDKILIIKPCNTKKSSQLWRVDNESRLHNKRNDSKCIRQSGRKVFYSKCDDPALEDTSPFVAFNMLNKKLVLVNSFIVLGYRCVTVMANRSIQLRPNSLTKDLRQEWSIDYGYSKQLIFVANGKSRDNPCATYSDSGHCEECFGDCDYDDDCFGNLRCAHRVLDRGLENVPGCEWAPNSDFFRYMADDYCFQPIALSGIVNYVGECNRGTKNGYTYYCGECEGNCVNDADCQQGLTCMERHGFEAVIGCTGHGGAQDMYAKNICYVMPSASPSSLPSSSPTFEPSKVPSKMPSQSPSSYPSSSPTSKPSISSISSKVPTESSIPSLTPTESRSSRAPSISSIPSEVPTESSIPSLTPTESRSSRAPVSSRRRL